MVPLFVMTVPAEPLRVIVRLAPLGMTFASGTAGTGSYSNTATAYGDFTDSGNHLRSDTATDGSTTLLGLMLAQPRIDVDSPVVPVAGSTRRFASAPTKRCRASTTSALPLASGCPLIMTSVETVNAMLEDAQTGAVLQPAQPDGAALDNLVRARQPRYVTFADWLKLDELELEWLELQTELESIEK